jgi:hypothetical protein
VGVGVGGESFAEDLSGLIVAVQFVQGAAENEIIGGRRPDARAASRATAGDQGVGGGLWLLGPDKGRAFRLCRESSDWGPDKGRAFRLCRESSGWCKRRVQVSGFGRATGLRPDWKQE